MATAWITVDTNGASQMGTAFSTDDGATWGPPTVVATPMNRVGSDPVLAVDAAGNIYLAWVGYLISGQGNPFSMRIYVARADAGTTTFGQPVRVSPQNDNQAQYDKPWITVTNGGSIVVTYQRSGPPNEFGIVAARSADLGMTWQRTFVANDPSGSLFRNLAFPCSTKSGNRVYATYLAFDGVDMDTRLSRSDDGGATWGPELIVSLPNEPVAFDDPSCAADLDQVYVAYGLSMDPLDDSTSETQKLHSIQLTLSNNAGQSVAARGEIADLPAAKFFMHPQIARETTGGLDVVYYTGSFDEDPNGAYRWAHAPAGLGFSPTTIAETPVTYLQARSDLRWVGDYVGIHWRAGQLYTSYVTNATGTAHIAFAKYLTPNP